MAKAEFIGIDSIVGYIEKYPATKIELFQGSRCVYEDHLDGDDTSEDLIDRFIRFAEVQPAHNFATYKLDVTWKKPGNKNSSKISPNIAFNPPPGGEYLNSFAKKETKNTSPSGDLGFSPREFIEATTRAAILAEENARLKEEIEQLSEENEQLETQVPTGEQEPKNIGAVLSSALYANADKIIAVIADKLFGNGSAPSMALNGIPGQQVDVHALVNQMMLIEPEFPEHLQMLINLRKNNPTVYSIALNQLKSM